MRRAGRIAGAAIPAVFALACAVLGAAALLPAALGLQRYVITSGSMTGTYDRGSLVFDKAVPSRELKVGDVITYAPPSGSFQPGELVTHRIIWKGRDVKGKLGFRTKGDANPVADPWRFTLDRPTQARVVFSVPYLGYAFAALGLRPVRMAVIGLPALLIMLSVLRGLWREAGEDERRRRAEETATA